MISASTASTMRIVVAIVLFLVGAVSGSAVVSAVASRPSTAPCTVDVRDQAASNTTWSVPPQNTSGRPGQPF